MGKAYHRNFEPVEIDGVMYEPITTICKTVEELESHQKTQTRHHQESKIVPVFNDNKVKVGYHLVIPKTEYDRIDKLSGVAYTRKHYKKTKKKKKNKPYKPVFDDNMVYMGKGYRKKTCLAG